MIKKISRSIGVVLLGFMVNAILSVVTDFLLESAGVLPPPEKGLFETRAIILVLCYRTAYAVMTGALVARLAESRPMLHAMSLGLVAVTLTTAAVSSSTFAEKAPMWFGYVLVAIILPSLWAGVRLARN